jgi:microcystin-dependent protein
MANYEATKYDFDGANLTDIEGIPTATIIPWSESSVPSGYLECNGQAVSRSTYAALFAIVGTTYGAGDGSSTFLVPNLSDNVPIGKSNNKALASTGGANTVTNAGNIAGSTANATLSTPQLASHSHNKGWNPNNSAFRSNRPMSHPYLGPTASPAGSGNSGSGGGHSHNMSANLSWDATSVVQPYLTIMYLIKT